METNPDGTTVVSTPPYGSQSSAAVVTGTMPSAGMAQVTVKAPADAKVWVDGMPTTSTGTVRTFESPPLMSGARYGYLIQAGWKEKGHETTQSQWVEVTPGARVTVRFPSPSKTAGQASVSTGG